MRIIHLEASTGWGGQEIRILQEAKAMRERGHILSFAIMKGGVLATRAREAGFDVCELNFHYRGWGKALCQLLWILRKQQIDIVNTHSSLDAWIGGIAARLAGKKIVRTRHLSTPVRSGWNSRTLYRTLADFVVTTCEAIIAPLSQQSKRPLTFFRSIATGVDTEKIQVNWANVEAFRSKIGAKDSFLVGTACFMRSWKGIEEFLQAAALLREKSEIKWVLIGGGNADYYRKMAEGMGLGERVHFTGHLENPFDAMAALDVFTLLSTANEGVSQAILQAAFLQKPLIATPTGGLCEVCLDGHTGFLVPPFAPEQVADGVLRLHADASLREKMGQAAAALVREKFTFQQTVDGMEQIYNAVGKR